MKLRHLPLLCLVALCACQGREHEAPKTMPSAQDVFHAQLDIQETKVYMNEGLQVFWNADDRVSVFARTTENRQFRFSGADGANEGELVPVGAATSGSALDKNYAAFPYSSANSISAAGTMNLTFPSAQTYCAGTFDPSAQVMVASSTSSDFTFKNVMSLVGFQLYGSGVQVKSVKFTGNSGETLAGAVAVTAGDAPTYSFSGTGQKVLTLTASTPVTLDAVTPTVFWFVVPPMTFSDGFHITVTASDNKVFNQAVHREIVLARNTAYKMESIQVVPVTDATPTAAGIYEEIGINYEFDATKEQVSVYEAEDQVWVRYLNTDTMKMYQVGPIPANASTGAHFDTDFTVSQGGTTISSSTLPMTVVSLENDILTLQTGNSYYVLKF